MFTRSCLIAIAACGAPAASAGAGAPTSGHANVVEVGALAGKLPDLDAPTLATMAARAGCGAPRDATARYVCTCMTAFAAGGRPVLANDTRMIGVGAKIDRDNAIDPTLELLALDYHRPDNFHEEVMLGDTMNSFPVVPQTADEARQIADATAALVGGHELDNPATAFARTMEPTQTHSLQDTDGVSVALGTRTRMLVRQRGDTVVVIEAGPTNAKALESLFYVQCYRPSGK